MSKELTKKAAEMLLDGGTLLSEHCPYCSGVRVMKDGQALCVSCGRKPEKRDVPNDISQSTKSSLEETLEKKIEHLSKELADEDGYEKQQEILKSINSMLETLGKAKDRQ